MCFSISDESGLDRTLLDLSSRLAEPLCFAYGLLRYRLVAPLDPKKFDNADSQTVEVAKRALIAASASAVFYLLPLPLLFTATALGVGSKLLRAAGFALQKNGYTHVRGNAEEKRLEQREAKVMTWNVCGIGGGMHYDHGGLTDWRSRFDGIVQQIQNEDPDVLVLQEIYDTAFAEKLVEQFKERYAHFYLHLGPNVWGSVGGGMVLSKCAVSRFASIPFANNEWTLNRTFATLEIKANPGDPLPCVRIIGTHLIHDDNTKRMQQVVQMTQQLAREELPLPTILMGDLNLERDRPAEGGALTPLLTHAYQGAAPTATNRLLWQWTLEPKGPADETIDYISLFRERAGQLQMAPSHLIEAFTPAYNTQTALSDHHGLATTLQRL